jgi:hypothetical protein
LVTQRTDIDKPTFVVSKGVLMDPHAFELGQVVKQRIRRPRDEDFITRIAEQLEEKRVCFARARGEKHAIRINGLTSGSGIVAGYCLARAPKTEGNRFVFQAAGVGKRVVKIWILDACMGRIRLSQVENGRSRETPFL